MRLQVHLLPLDRPGEARRLTNLPRGVDELRLVARRAAAWPSSARRTARRSPRMPAAGAGRRSRPARATPPTSDFHYVDRLRDPVQRRRLGLPPGHPAVGRRRRVRASDAWSTPAGRPIAEPAWSPGRQADRVQRRPRPRRRPGLPQRRVGRPSRGRPGRPDHRRWPPARCGRASSASPAWLPDGATAGRPRPSLGGGNGQPGRRLAVRGRRLRFRTARRPEPDGRGRPGHRFGHGQRRDDRRGQPDPRGAGRPGRLLQRPDRRLLRAVAGARRRWSARAADRAAEHYYSSFAIGSGPRGAVRIAAVLSAPTVLPEVVAARAARRPRSGRRSTAGPSPR